jgi:hypothetical protein
MSIRNLPALVCAALVSAGCSRPAPAPKAQYAVSPKEALQRLEAADIIGLRNARQCGMLIHFTPIYPDDGSFGWSVTTSGEEVAKFTISLSAFENGTNATINVPEAPGGGEMYDGKQEYDHPALMQPLRPAVLELIDSAIEKRPYDWQRIEGTLSAGPGETASRCGNGNASLKRGSPWRLEDPPGMSHEDAVRLGLASE